MADHALAHDREQGEGVEVVEATGGETATAAAPHSLLTVLTTVPPLLTEEPSPLPSLSVTSWESKTTTGTLQLKLMAVIITDVLFNTAIFQICVSVLLMLVHTAVIYSCVDIKSCLHCTKNYIEKCKS